MGGGSAGEGRQSGCSVAADAGAVPSVAKSDRETAAPTTLTIGSDLVTNRLG